MNNKDNNFSRQKSNEIEEKQAMINKTKNSKYNGKISAQKNETPNQSETVTLLNNRAKVMIEDFKGKISLKIELSNSWIDHYHIYNENLNKIVHNVLKYLCIFFLTNFLADHKKKIETLKTNPTERKKKIELLYTIKEQFGN